MPPQEASGMVERVWLPPCLHRPPSQAIRRHTKGPNIEALSKAKRNGKNQKEEDSFEEQNSRKCQLSHQIPRLSRSKEEWALRGDKRCALKLFYVFH